MFDRIAPTYDFLNRILSAGIDRQWRKQVACLAPELRRKMDYLDVATGTGDQLFTVIEQLPDRIQSAHGVDLAEKMLARARHKTRPAGTAPILIEWCTGSAESLPFAEETFDFVTISFGIRNVGDPVAGLREMRRVLRPGGRILVLEFSLPTNVFLRTGYLFYFRHVLPRIGGWISGQFTAYRYLNQTVEDFPSGDAFLALMKTAGFEECRALPLTFGIASLYLADKAALEEMA